MGRRQAKLQTLAFIVAKSEATAVALGDILAKENERYKWLKTILNWSQNPFEVLYLDPSNIPVFQKMSFIKS